MRAGIFQCEGGGLTPLERLAKVETALQANEELDLLVCPELFLSGYNVGDQITALAEPVHGPFAQRLAELARQYRTALVYGYPERGAEGEVFNSAACLSADGELLANHRKLMLPPGFESRYFLPGDGFTLFTLGSLRCGLVICYDAEFPETLRALAQAGAQVVFVPTALNDAWSVVSERVMPARAFENGLWLLYANHAGQEGDIRYFGGSCIVAPDGRDAARAGSAEDVIAADLSAAAVTAAQSRLPYLPAVTELQIRLRGGDQL
ncbi:carbon-nitrogen hydrolase family protein [Rhodovibrionaceae bacterium A322]